MYRDLLEAGAEEPHWWREKAGNTVYVSYMAGAGWGEGELSCA
jgi:hypothetical protein